MAALASPHTQLRYCCTTVLRLIKDSTSYLSAKSCLARDATVRVVVQIREMSLKSETLARVARNVECSRLSRIDQEIFFVADMCSSGKM